MININICEIFGNTIQGEGPLAGQPATFVRLAKCIPPYCDFCDSKYSWEKGEQMSIDDVLIEIEKLPANLVVITGGEPYLQKSVYDLIEKLSDKYRIQIETSGKVDIIRQVRNELIVCSPKQYNGKIHYNIVSSKPHFYKFVIGGKDDFRNVIEFVKRKEIPNSRVYLMPLTTNNEEVDIKIKQATVDLCVEFNFNYSARLHVDLWGQKRGV